MTTYDKIVQLLELGTLKGVACRGKDGGWKIFIHIDCDGGLYGPHEGNAIDDCLGYGLDRTYYSEDTINKDFTDEIVPIPNIPKRLEPGTKVDILPEFEEWGEKKNWHKEVIKMAGARGLEIRNYFGGDYIIYNKDKSDHVVIPFWAVIPSQEECEKYGTIYSARNPDKCIGIYINDNRYLFEEIEEILKQKGEARLPKAKLAP